MSITYLLIVIFLVGCSIIFFDQAYWQNTIAAKPKQGMWGFISAGMAAVTIPLVFGTVIGFSYMSLSFKIGSQILHPDDWSKNSQLKALFN